MDFTIDANGIDEPARRRQEFTRWLLSAWEFCLENCSLDDSLRVADLIAHLDEPDFPLWEEAQARGITDDGFLAKRLRAACGVHPDGPRASYWEKSINYSPVIQLDPETWQYIYDQMGWSNRSHDHNMNARNFYLWSPAGNVIRFIVRKSLNEVMKDAL